MARPSPTMQLHRIRLLARLATRGNYTFGLCMSLSRLIVRTLRTDVRMFGLIHVARPNLLGAWCLSFRDFQKFARTSIDEGYKRNHPDDKKLRARQNVVLELGMFLMKLGRLEALKRPCRVKVITDSQYLAQAFRGGWLEKWKRNGWRTADKKPIKNIDLWKELDRLANVHEITWEWVEGHAGHPGNERADQLAVAAREHFVEGSTKA